MDLLISSATHRTGSTLVQRMFNARKKTLIWGENGGCLTDFCNIYKNALHYSETFKDVRDSFFNDGQDPNQWIACMTPRSEWLKKTLIKTVKDFHHQLYVEEHQNKFDMIGYKEVRYGKEELQLFRECYPDCPVILLIRHPANVWKSVSRRARNERYGSPEAFAALWKRRVNEYIDLDYKDHNMHLIRYEDVIAKKNKTMSLIKKLGNISDHEIDDVLNVKISSSSKKTPPREIAKINALCKNILAEVGYEEA